MKKYFILFAYWWCIMYPNLGLNVPTNIALENQTYEFKFKIVESVGEFFQSPISVKSST